MRWSLSWRADPKARAIADRHYNRQSVGAAQFVPPGRCLVLTCESALWITSWPFAEYVKHAWAGAWVWRWPGVPSVGAREIRRRHDRTDIERIRIAMVTFVDRAKTRAKRDAGRCFRKFGFIDVGETDGGLVALGLPIDALPPPERPHGAVEQLVMEGM